MARHRNNKKTEQTEIWQWNCCSLRTKLENFKQFIGASPIPPDIICLQEVGKFQINLRGYIRHVNPKYPQVATFTKKDIALSVSYVSNEAVQHQIITVWPKKRGGPKTVGVNIYSPPKERRADFENIIAHAMGLLKEKDRLVIMGDFNAPHRNWGYKQDSPKGKLLVDLVERYDLCQLTQPDLPTRVGNSLTKDTSPDLTFTNSEGNVSWAHLGENLGSDHYILGITINAATTRRMGKATISDWNKFRENVGDQGEIIDLGNWVTQIKEAHRKVTKEIETSVEIPAVDKHLLHLWDARRSLTKRWRKQKLNRKLKIRIAQLSQEANDYARQLNNSNWRQFSNSLRGTLGTKKTWHILRSMIDPGATKTMTNRALRILENEFKGNDDALIYEVKKLYVGQDACEVVHGKYAGKEQPELDAPITFEEVYAAAQSFKKNTAPGRDKITNSMLRNLSDAALRRITDFFNEKVWVDGGNLPVEWKDSNIMLIPKPEKPRDIKNLRPISLTSCLGKLFEKTILTRLTDYVEREGLLPVNMFGFRPHVSAQDVFLLLQNDVMNPNRGSSDEFVLALDIKKAFDTISHKVIMEGLESINCGQRIYEYVRSFLTSRKATISLGSVTSETFDYPNRGTPQGAMLSPILFNIGLRKLACELENIKGLGAALYADDVTLWTKGGSYADKENALQEAVDKIQAFVTAAGMQCSPEKTEMVRIRARYAKKKDLIPVAVLLDGRQIREADVIRVLGMWIQGNSGTSHTLQRLRGTTANVARMIRRIANSEMGLEEKETIALVHAFVISRVTYALPYQTMTNQETKQINTIIRKAFKAALGIPENAKTERVEKLGIYNTFEEYANAVLLSQKERLNSSYHGRRILEKMGYTLRPLYCDEETVLIDAEKRTHLTVAPIPRNMHPTYHAGRRKARADSLRKAFQNSSEAVFTDVSKASRGSHVVAIVAQNHTTMASVKTCFTRVAEAAAIAIAISNAEIRGESVVVLSDSQAACRMFLRGTLPKIAYKFLNKPITGDHHIIWCPAHEGLEGNVVADRIARGITNRATAGHDVEPLSNSRDILLQQRKQRKEYGLPHKDLDSQQSRDWRRIQTNSFPNLYHLSRIYPARYKDTCPWCSQVPTLSHITWECTQRPTHIDSPHITKQPHMFHRQWEAWLADEDKQSQIALLDQVQRAARASGALD